MTSGSAFRFKATLDICIKTILTKVNINMGLLQKLQQVLPRQSLTTFYKALSDLTKITEMLFLIKLLIEIRIYSI